MLKSYFLKPKEGPYRRALSKNDLDEEYITFDVDVPRQMVSEEEMVALESKIDSSVDFLQGQFIVSFILNLTLNGVMSQLWNIFNTM